MNRRGFTLIELLISMAIGLLLVSLGFSVFVQIRKTISRTEARVDMHQRAGVVYRTLRGDLSSAMGNCGMWVRSGPSDPADPSEGQFVELVFMKGKIEGANWNWAVDAVNNNNSDTLWTIWRWSQKAGTLSAGSNRWARSFTNRMDWPPPSGVAGNNNNWRDKSFRIIPKPVRTFTDMTKPWETLDTNVIRITPVADRDADDIGDYQDLLREIRPMLRSVSACTFELVMSDGSAITFDGSVPMVKAFEGIPMDTSVPPDSPRNLVDEFKRSAMARRPRLLRMRFTLDDTTVDLQQSFSVSAQFPGVLPGPPP